MLCAQDVAHDACSKARVTFTHFLCIADTYITNDRDHSSASASTLSAAEVD